MTWRVIACELQNFARRRVCAPAPAPTSTTGSGCATSRIGRMTWGQKRCNAGTLTKKADPSRGAQGQHMGGALDSVREDIRCEVAALATRYGLAHRASKTLQAFADLVDWGAPNFFPKSDHGDRPKGHRPRPKKQRLRIASSVFADSLAGLELEPVRAARRVADIGSGAGFPGMVLAIALPRARMTLIEKVPEKCSFLRHTIDDLGLDNVEVVEGQVRRWSKGMGRCDVVTSRKMHPPQVMVKRSAPLLVPGGSVALWPGPKGFPEDAPAAAAEAAEAAGLRLARALPLESENRHGNHTVRHLYLYEKVGEADRPATGRLGSGRA
jgi:16S rRNA (guanine527-N7)-methyltransferase